MSALEPIAWPESDEYSDPITYAAGERYWWHSAIAAELRRLAAIGYPAYSATGIAGNVHMNVMDVTKYLRMMLTWGELVKAEALWDFEPDAWVSLAPQYVEVDFWKAQS